jgi:hypothetical protein
MSRAFDLLARAVVGFVFGPVDRTVCRFAAVTHDERT